MKNMFKITTLAFLFCFGGVAHAVPALKAVFTVDVATIKSRIAFKGCAGVMVVAPDSDTIYIYDDNTFTEEVYVYGSPNYIYGTWGSVDGANASKFRFNYTGNAGERTGSWGDYVTNMESAATNACFTTIDAYGATLRLLKAEVAVKTALPGTGSGTATSKFQTEVYGYSWAYDMFGKATESTSKSGTFVWQ